MENDHPAKKRPAKPSGMIDLPMGPGTPSQRPPTKGQAPPPNRPPSTQPRHVRPRPSRRGGAWLWVLLLVLGAGAAYWFLLRPPKVTVDAASLAFEATEVGLAAEPATVTITNSGRRPLEVLDLALEGEASGEFSVGASACAGLSLTAQESCPIEVRFEPATAGERRAGLIVTTNAPGEALAVPLAGRGLAPALTPDMAVLDYGRVALGKASETLTLSLVNTGSAPLSIARLAVEGSGESSFVWVANGCSGESLPPQEGCAVRIAFQPRETGEFKAALRVWSDAPEEPEIALTGLGVAPGLFMRPSSLDFGELRPGQESAARTIEFENTGNAPLTIDRLELVGAASFFALAANTCDGKTLEGETKCSAAIQYRPRDPGRHRAALRVRSGELRKRHEVSLSGAALAPRIALSETRLDFGRVVQYGTNEREVRVENTGSAPLALRTVDVEGGRGAFGISRSACPESLAPGEGCVLKLRFSPSVMGALEARLEIQHNAPGFPATVGLGGTASALPTPAIRVAPAEVGFGSLPVDERSEILTVRVESSGSARLPLSGYEISGRHAGDFRIVPASCEGLDSLLPDSGCTIGVRFQPTATGPRSAQLTVRHGATGGRTQITLSGEGY